MKHYDMTVLYHPSKYNVIRDAQCTITMGSVICVKESMKDLVNEVHRLSLWGVRLEDS